jgi:hypothetical protein
MCEGLSAAKASIGRVNGASNCEHRTVAFQHDETCALIGKPSQRGERNEAIGPDHHEASQAVPHAGKASLAAVRGDTVFNRQVTAFNAYAYSVSEERYNAVSRDE